MTAAQRQSAGGVLTVLYRVALIVAVGLIGWGGNAYYEAEQKINDRILAGLDQMAAATSANAALDAAQQTSLDNVAHTVDGLVANSYSDKDAVRDFRARDQKDEDQDRRLGTIEVQIRDIDHRMTPTRIP